MDKLPEKYHLSQTQETRKNLKSPIPIKEIETEVIKASNCEKNPGPIWLHC